MIIFHILLILMQIEIDMDKEKQERTVLHLELNGEHHYFGSVKALCDNFGKEEIGIGYKALVNYGITFGKPFSNKYCIVRKGVLITTPKNQPRE